MTCYSILKTPLGDLMLVANETELTALHFMDGEEIPAAQKNSTRNEAHPVLKKAAQELKEYFAGKRNTFSYPASSSGTNFQKRVWQEIAKIPFGQTISYSELAKKAGKPKAIRAAGTATGKNPLCIMVPCHRVLAKNGSIGGYAGGLERKRFLLDLENNSKGLTHRKK